eukprot:g5305.t1
MQTPHSVVVLCLALVCVSSCNGARVERFLLQFPAPVSVSISASASCIVTNGGNCQATSRVSTQAISDAARDIQIAANSAVTSVIGNGNVVTISQTFARAVAQAFARIISSHVLSVYINGNGRACAYTRSNAQSYASAIASAVSSAFAGAENSYIRSAAECYQRAVSAASVTAIQNVRFGVCTNYGYDYIYQRIETTVFVRTVAEAFARVLAAVINNDAFAAQSCGTSTSLSVGANTNFSG